MNENKKFMNHQNQSLNQNAKKNKNYIDENTNLKHNHLDMIPILKSPQQHISKVYLEAMKALQMKIKILEQEINEKNDKLWGQQTPDQSEVQNYLYIIQTLENKNQNQSIMFQQLEQNLIDKIQKLEKENAEQSENNQYLIQQFQKQQHFIQQNQEKMIGLPTQSQLLKKLDLQKVKIQQLEYENQELQNLLVNFQKQNHHTFEENNINDRTIQNNNMPRQMPSCAPPRNSNSNTNSMKQRQLQIDTQRSSQENYQNQIQKNQKKNEIQKKQIKSQSNQQNRLQTLPSIKNTQQDDEELDGLSTQRKRLISLQDNNHNGNLIEMQIVDLNIQYLDILEQIQVLFNIQYFKKGGDEWQVSMLYNQLKQVQDAIQTNNKLLYEQKIQ